MALLRTVEGASHVSVDRVEADGGPRAALERRLGLFAAQAEERAATELDGWRGAGITPLAFTDPRFPRRARDMEHCPPMLWLRGALEDDDAGGVAIIGTRQPRPDGVRAATALAEALTAAGRTVISGLALGIDAAAHLGALEAGGRSIAVLGNGLDHVYPSAHIGLQRRMHVLVSQFWPEQGPDRTTFPARNALMAALAAATVIVEAGPRSGARIQARHALAQGRPLFLCASLLREAWARTLAPQAGVRVIASPDQLLRELG